jgi:RNA polymerase sigma factor (sigma-70 family)
MSAPPRLFFVRKFRRPWRRIDGWPIVAGGSSAVIDPADVSRWFDAHAAALALFARQWFADRAAADDVVQDAFVALMNQRRAPTNVRAWLFTAVRNAAISRARGAARRVRREAEVVADRSDWFEPRVDDLIDASAARAALGSLPREQREVIVMRLWGQMTLAEIAGVTGDAVSTLFSRYRAGLVAIRQQMESSCRTKTD